MFRKWIFFFILCANAYSNICFELNLPENDIYNFNDNILIEGHKGVKLAANLLTPKHLNTKLPTIIFVNSWTLEEHEYLKQAIEFVKKGYQVLSYSTRGWGCSEGYVDVIGPKDIGDLKKVVDWLYQNTNIDKEKLGIAGISYGGGMSLMAMAKEPRIKVAFAMSAWASLYEAMYHQETPRKFWSEILVATGFLLGRIDGELSKRLKKLLTSNHDDSIVSWAAERSALTYIDEINKRRAPIYISNNFGDNLFQPNNVIRFFEKLKGPKILDLNQGTHATGELTGLFTVSNYTFNRLHSWFDYWLKSDRLKSRINLNTINLQTDLKHKRESISDTLTTRKEELLTLSLHPRESRFGTLKIDKYSDKEVIDSISSAKDSFASTGIPLISSLVDGHFKIPVYTFMPLIGSKYAFRYESEKLNKAMKIRGIPKLKAFFDSEQRPYQVVAYLYDINSFGAGKLITHGVSSGSNINGLIDMEIVATAYDIPKGHRLGLVIDTFDLLYAKKSDETFRLNLIYSSQKNSVLEIPLK